MSEWTEEAEPAIAMCAKWATDVVAIINCQLFLFGSAIYKGGEQFDRISSDLDIVCLFPENTTALSRVVSLQNLYVQKQSLELLMVSTLQRRTCDEPGVSIVAITPVELRANIHKSGARSFFDKNIFYDLVAKKQTLGIPLAGTRMMRDESRQALEYVQKVRNEYLSVSANDTGGLEEFVGPDPLPKALLRSAAQLLPDSAEGEWYDTRLGLELMHEILRDRRADNSIYKILFDKVSVRRGGRGRRVSLSADDQLLLAEMLFDRGATASTEAVITWDIQIAGKALTEENVKEVFASITRVVPDAKLIGKRFGSLILRIRSARSGFEVLQELAKLDVLARILRVDGARVSLVHDENFETPDADDSLEATLVRLIFKWSPDFNAKTGDIEDNLAEYLVGIFETEPDLGAVKIMRDVQFAGVEIPFEMDFLLSRERSDRTVERIGIEVVRLRSPSTFFQKVAQLLPLGRPVLLVALGQASLLEQLRGDISRLGQLNANVHVVSIPTEE
jgi:hypothetical protein